MPRGSALFRIVALSLPISLLACGGHVDASPDPAPLPDAGGEGDDGSDAGAQADARPDVADEAAPPWDYRDPDCDEAPPAPPILECDPLAEPTGCAEGEACSPFVDYPRSECEKERYGALCVPEGEGTQGSPCGDGVSSCKSGFVCVISGAGVQCVELCDLETIGSCPDGLVCEPIDVQGFGGCL